MRKMRLRDENGLLIPHIWHLRALGWADLGFSQLFAVWSFYAG